VELAKRGKASTVLVDCKTDKGRYGSVGFPHERPRRLPGWSTRAITLIIQPGEKSQRLLRAKVIQSDKDLGLA
jgi:hypothetical protein